MLHKRYFNTSQFFSRSRNFLRFGKRKSPPSRISAAGPSSHFHIKGSFHTIHLISSSSSKCIFREFSDHSSICSVNFMLHIHLNVSTSVTLKWLPSSSHEVRGNLHSCIFRLIYTQINYYYNTSSAL